MLVAASVELHVTSVVVSIVNVEFEAGTHVTAGVPSTASVAVELKVTFAPVAPVASAKMSAGTVTTGAVVSTTVMVNVLVALFAASSVAVHKTGFGPNANVDPEGGTQLTVGDKSTVSVAVGEMYVAFAPADEVASTIKLAGVPLITGAVVS